MSLGSGLALELLHVTKSFGSRVVLDDVSLQVAKGERVALIGRSGSGKSTILRMSVGLEVPDRGEVLAFGQSFWPTGLSRGQRQKALRQARSPIEIVFQAYNLFPHMTVMQNMIEAPRSVLGLPRDEASDRALSLLQRVGLRGKESAKPSQLSGGEKQRVAMARALMMEPRLLLFDEVTSALDPELVAEVLGVIEAVASESDAAMLIVTHEMKFASAVADRVCFLDGGVIAEEGPAEQVIGDPQTKRAQEFLGLIGATKAI